MLQRTVHGMRMMVHIMMISILKMTIIHAMRRHVRTAGRVTQIGTKAHRPTRAPLPTNTLEPTVKLVSSALAQASSMFQYSTILL